MAKKLNNIYLEENEELETHTILVDGDESFIKRNKARNEKEPNKVWAFFRPIVIFVAAMAIVILGGYYVYNAFTGAFLAPVDEDDHTAVEVTIARGSSLSAIADLLEEKELVRNKQFFKLYTDFSDKTSKLRAGTYQLSKSMTYDDIIYTISRGMDGPISGTVVLVEGMTTPVFAKDLVTAGLQAEDTAYLAVARTAEGVRITNEEMQEVIAFDAQAAEKRLFVLEGYLFPDTYEFYTDAEAGTIVQRQVDRFNEVFNDIYKNRAAELGMTMDDIVTIASIIEKEAKAPQFKQLSSVVHNRLREGMRLQMDSTQRYALDAETLLLSQIQLDTDTPYNTHTREGLPLGPICNPGRAAIEAALWPDETLMEDGDEYFFVALTDPDSGELVFSRTLDEHNAVVAEYEAQWQAVDAEKAAQVASYGDETAEGEE